MPDKTITVDEFHTIINLACDAVGTVTEKQRSRLLALGPGRYALGAFIRDGVSCPIEAAFGFHAAPDASLPCYSGTPLLPLASELDHQLPGEWVVVV